MKEPLHTSPHWARGVYYYIRALLRRRPRMINLEFTKRCNARCDFCACWQEKTHDELMDYSDVVKSFRPVVLSISGGEPLLRRDYPELIRGVRPYCHYMIIITNGALLNKSSAQKLIESGVDQICVSLDYLSEEHDEARKIKGLFAHVSKTIPELSDMGYRIVLNTVITQKNLDQIIPIIHRAKEWGVSVSISSYCSLKMDEDSRMIDLSKIKELKDTVEEIKGLKKKFGNVKNSDHYLNHIVEYFENGSMPNCKAGIRWLQVTPNGQIQPCSELPATCHYSEYKRSLFPTPSCTKCWYSCRGEAEANPLVPKRLLELIRS